MYATEYASYYGIPPQAADESDYAFRARVSGALRDMGKIIEAHEAHTDSRYEENDDVMTGVLGAVAQALHGTNYGSKGYSQVGDDIAAGVVAQCEPHDAGDAMMAMLAMMMFGGKR